MDSESGAMVAIPTTPNLLPDLASTHSPLTSDLSLKIERFLIWNLSAYLFSAQNLLAHFKGEFISHFMISVQYFEPQVLERESFEVNIVERGQRRV
jgi:hypothetical protein